jgi:hypothetical protein
MVVVPVRGQHGQPDTDSAVLTAVDKDLLYLPAVRAAEHAH